MARRYVLTKATEETISDANTPASSSGSVLGLLGGLANRLRAITGKGSWTQTPDANLADAASHHADRSNPHNVTRAQLGAAAQTALDSHTASQQNPHGVSATQAKARPDTWVPAWSDVTGKPASFPSTWNEVASKPAAFPPSAHNQGWTTITGKPTSYPPETHTHDYAPSTHTHDYAPASHVGSGGGNQHPNVGRTGASGFMAAADKAKLDDIRPNDAYCDLTLSAHQTGVASATWTPVAFNVENADPLNWHSTTNPERITFSVGGFYAVTFYQRWATANGSGVRYLRGLKNGSVIFEDSVSAGVDSVGRVTAARMFAVSPGDYFQVEVNQTSGSSLDLHSVTSMGVARIM